MWELNAPGYEVLPPLIFKRVLRVGAQPFKKKRRRVYRANKTHQVSLNFDKRRTVNFFLFTLSISKR